MCNYVSQVYLEVILVTKRVKIGLLQMALAILRRFIYQRVLNNEANGLCCILLKTDIVKAKNKWLEAISACDTSKLLHWDFGISQIILKQAPK